MSIAIDITNDLKEISALRTRLSRGKEVKFTLAENFALFYDKPVMEAAKAKVSSALAPSGSPGWTLPGNIVFGLDVNASCTVGFSLTSTAFPVAMNIDSPGTTDVVLGPTPGLVYVNLDLDFGITSSLTASGTFSGIGVAGKVAGGRSATLSFCHPVAEHVLTLQALKDALNHLVFPIDPACTVDMDTGSLAKVSFDGTFKCGLDVTYGLGAHQFSAASVPIAKQALHNGFQMKMPAAGFNAGAKASVTYLHSDHFTLLVQKDTDQTALVYLARAAQSDVVSSVGITAGVTVTNASVAMDPDALKTAVSTVIGNAIVADGVAKAASFPVNKLSSSLNAKLQSFFKDYSGQTGLTLSLARQKGHTALFAFNVDLTNPTLAGQSWSALVDGSVIDALALKGFTLIPGSGIADSLQRSCTISFRFFNFTDKTVAAFFSNAYTEFGPDGTIRVFRDVGEFEKNTANGKSTEYRLHFVVTANEDNLQNIAAAEVDLYLESSETGRSGDGHTLANALGSIPANSSVNAAQSSMVTFLATNPAGTLDLVNVIKPSAYRKLTFTPITNGQPSKLFPVLDGKNWTAFRDATHTLIGVSDTERVTFPDWQTFNVLSNSGDPETGTADRRSFGGAQVVQSFYDSRGFRVPIAMKFFLNASTAFMNLCEDLTVLASDTQAALDETRWTDLMKFLDQIVTDDLYVQFAIPTAGALLALCSAGGSTASAVVAVPTGGSSLTCITTLI